MRYDLGRCHMLELFNETGTGPQDVIDRTGYTKSEVSDWSRGRRKMSLPTAFTVCKEMGWDIWRLYDLVPVKKSEKRRSKRQSTKG